jgi:hypothetical protein
MDLRGYWERIRNIEASIPDASVVVVSADTPDGGRRGVKTDVPRGVAARLIAGGKAALASPEEAEEFRARVEARWKAVRRPRL